MKSDTAETTDETMRVLKRDKSLENVNFNKIVTRLKTLSLKLSAPNVNCSQLCMKVIDQVHD